MFKTIDEVLRYIERRTSFDLGLKRITSFLKLTDIDYDQLKYIHVGGTNGKGSTANFLNHIFIESGYKTGFFSSPSIEVHNDRVRINNQYIDDQYIIDFVNKYHQSIEDTGITMFEIDVALALAYFVENKVDIVILEVGMGGEYDGTNIITPLLSIITNISFDHTTHLGKDITKIAQAKAGIIKKDIPIITAETNEKVLAVLQTKANEVNAPFYTLKQTNIIDYYPLSFEYDKHVYQLKSLAQYQVKNASLVIESIKLLNKYYDFNIKDEIVHNVLKNTIWPGRFEIISLQPLVVIDGAHNVAGIEMLVKTLANFKQNKTIMFSALADKDTDEMLELLMSTKAEIILTEFDFYRVKKAVDLRGILDLKIESDYQTYITNKIKMMSAADMLVITGSLYFISEVRKYLLSK